MKCGGSGDLFYSILVLYRILFFFLKFKRLYVIKKRKGRGKKRRKKRIGEEEQTHNFDSTLWIFEKNQNCVNILTFIYMYVYKWFISFSFFLLFFFFFFSPFWNFIFHFIPREMFQYARSYASVTFNSHYSNPRFPFFRSAIRACVLFYYAGDNIF